MVRGADDDRPARPSPVISLILFVPNPESPMPTLRARRILPPTILMAAAGLTLALDARVDPGDTRMLTQPAISASHIAFIYAGDLFAGDLNGATVAGVRRLTTDDGVESNPAFSPDGRTIAFSAQYDGNVDVY